MTEAERQAIESAVNEAKLQLALFSLELLHADLEALYHAAKPVHEAALGIWTTIVNILREQHGLVKETSDAINLDELFGGDATGAGYNERESQS